MNLHEYQARTLLARYGVPVSPFRLVSAAGEAEAALSALGGERWAIKAQAHTGGRGKAGGVRLVEGRDAARAAIGDMLGMRLVTAQTGPAGRPVNDLLVEVPTDIAAEFYLGLVVDRSRQRMVLMASREGGVDIETVAARSPEAVLTAVIDPLVGLQPYQCRELAFGLGLEGRAFRQFETVARGLARAFRELDLSLVEINPLVLTRSGELLCIDAKMNVDDNALFRQAELLAMRDPRQEEPRELRAREFDLNYIALEGDIGCMVNGAGLAMATMDLIKLAGGQPANFLDVGGTATRERVTEAFKIILEDAQVRGVLVNIFGGIVRCDIIAEGIIGAVADVGIKVPVVVRLEGTNAERGRELLESSGLKIAAARGLAEAAERVVAALREGAA
ncbi:MAG: ADP-forming succinate--CoA ligase subunit beta [Gammaproteobacteria bacterium]|jgi:succinyl-CoA synthetase beta subunit|nr:ADP-forming succinate--CoA ligase subunit beta [Gammaproteobacteria bacterium]